MTLSVNNFVLDRTAVNKVTGSVSLTLAGLSLFPGNPVISTSVTGLAVTYDFGQGLNSTGRLSFSMSSLSLSIGGVSQLNAFNVVLNPGSMLRQGSDDVTLSLSGNLTIFDQVIEGSFAFTRSNGVITISAIITKLELSVGSTRIVKLDGSGDFLVNSEGLAGNFVLNLVQGPALADVAINGIYQLQVNTTPSHVVFGTNTILAGPYLRLAVKSATVSIFGNGITADQFVMEKTGTGAAAIVKVTASGVGLQLAAGTASLTVGGGSGAFVISATGVAGRVEVATVVLSGVPGVSLSASALAIEVNSTGADVAPVTVETSTGTVTIQYAGVSNRSFLRVRGTAGIDMDGFMKLAGSFAFERGTMTGGVQVLKGAVSNLSGTLGAGIGTSAETGVKISDVAGAFLMLPAGIAFSASGSAALVGLNGLELSGTVAVRVNTTAASVNETITTAAGPVSVVFASSAQYQAVSGTLVLNLGGFVRLSGAYTFEKSFDGLTTKVIVGATGVTAFMGEGTTGLSVANGNLGMVIFATAGTYALNMSGDASVSGISGVALTGRLAVRGNTTGLVVNELISTAGGSVAVSFADGTQVQEASGDITFAVAGFASLTGSYTFRKSGSGATGKVLAAATGINAFMGAGSSGVRIQNAQLVLAIFPANNTYALNASGTALLEGVSDVTLTGTLSAAVNTTGGAVSESITTSGGILQLVFTQQQGNIARFQGSGIELQLGSSVQVSGSFAVERSTMGGLTTLRMGAVGVSAFMAVDGKGVRITDGTLGLLLLGDGKYALQATGAGSVVGIPDVEAAGTLTLSINNTGQTRNETISAGAQSSSGQSINVALNMAASVSLSITGTNLALNIAGNGFTAESVMFTKGSSQIDVSGQKIAFTLRAGTRRILALADADFAFVLSSSGVAGAVRNGVIQGPDFGGNIGLSGTVSVLLNTTTTARTLTVGTQSVSLAAAPAAGRYFQVEVLLPVLTVYGSTLTADRFILERDESGVRVIGANLDFELRADSKRIIGLQDADFGFHFDQNGLVGAVKNATILGPDFGGNITVGGTVSLSLNTTALSQLVPIGGDQIQVAAAPAGGFFVRVEVVDGNLTVFGNQLSADRFVLEKAGADVSVSGTNLDILLAVGSTRVLALDNANFSLLFTQAGVAGAVLGGQFSGPQFSDVSLTGTVSLLLNTTTTGRVLNVAGQDVTVAGAPTAGYFVRVEVTGGIFTVLGSSFSADKFVFEKSGADVQVTGSNLGLQLTAGTSRILAIQNADFGFRFMTGGLFGAVKNATVLGPDSAAALSISGNVTVLFNTTASTQTVAVGAANIAVPAGAAGAPYVRVELQTGRIGILGQTLAADFVFEQTTREGEKVVTVRASSVHLGLGDGTTELLSVAGGAISLTIDSQGVAGDFAGTVTSNVPNVSLSGTFAVAVNTRNPADRYVRVSGFGSSLFYGNDLSDLSALVAKLVAHTDPVSDYVWGRLQTQSKQTLQNSESSPQDQLTVLISEFNQILRGESIYAAARFAGITLSAEATALLAQNPQGLDLIRLNRVLLEAAYPTQVLRSQGPGVKLTLAGQTMGGDFVVEQTKTAVGQTVVGVAVTNFYLSLGDGSRTYVAVTNGEGYFVFNASGVAASTSATVAVNIPGVTLTGGSVKVEINTTDQPVNANFLINGNPPSNLVLAAGPFVRVSVTGAQLAVGTGGPALSGNFFFEQVTRVDATKVVRFAAANVSVTYQGQGITEGAGAFVILPADVGVPGSGGIAGVLSGRASISVGGVAVGGSFGLRVNKTGLPVLENLSVNGQDFEIAFADGSSVFEFFGAILTLTIGDFVTIEGRQITFSAGSFAGTGINIFLGRGPALLPDGSPNPAAVGVQLANADAGIRDLGAGKYAMYASGTIELLGVPGITFAGGATISINQSTTTDYTFNLPGGPVGGVTVTRGALAFEATGMLFSLLGQSIRGNFAFSKPGAGAPGEQVVTVAASNVSAQVGPTGQALVSVSGGSGLFLITAAGVAGKASGTVTVNGGTGLALGGAYSLAINTIPAAVNQTVTAGSLSAPLVLPVGRYLRVSGVGATLTVGGQTLSGDFDFEQRTGGGVDGNVTTPGDNTRVVSVAFNNAALDLGGDLVTIRNGSGLFILGPTGLAGRATAALAIKAGAGASASGSFSLLINRTGAAVRETIDVGGLPVTIEAAAGNYIKVSGQNVSLSVLGNTLTGNFEFAQLSATEVTVAASQVSLNIGEGLVRLSNGTGAFLINTSGFAGSLTATVTVSAGTAVSLAGQFTLLINTSSIAVNQTFFVNGSSVTLNVPGGPYLRIQVRGATAGTQATLTVAGQTLRGDFDLERRVTVGATPTTVTTIAFQNVAVELGDGTTPLLTVSGGRGLFLLSATGLAGKAEASMTINPTTGVGFTGAVSLEINNTTAAVNQVFGETAQTRVTLDLPAGPYLRLAGVDIQLMIGSALALRGNFSFERRTTRDNKQVIRVGASNVSASLIAGSVSLALTGGSGLFVLQAAGIAGRAAGAVSLNGVSGVTLAANMELEFNRTGAAINETIGTEMLAFSETNFIRIRGSATLKIAGVLDVSGNFGFESATSSGGATVVKAGATQVNATLGVPGSFGVQLSDATLALMLFDGGKYALDATGNVALTGSSSLSLTGSIALRVNKTNAEVHESFSVGSQTLTLDFGATETNSTRFAANNAVLTTPLSTLTGNFAFEKDGVTNEIFAAATGVQLFVGSDKGTPSTSDDIGVRVSNASLALLLVPGGQFALEASGTPWCLEHRAGSAIWRLPEVEILAKTTTVTRATVDQHQYDSPRRTEATFMSVMSIPWVP